MEGGQLVHIVERISVVKEIDCIVNINYEMGSEDIGEVFPIEWKRLVSQNLSR